MPGRLIAHQIQKSQHSRETQVLLRDALLPSAGELPGVFVQELRTAVTSRNPVAGRFMRPAGGQPPFEQRLRRYLNSVSDAQFVQFTRDATELLATRMRGESLATGGYVVFSEYDQADVQFLLVAVLSTKAHPSFDAQLNLVSSVTLDFEHLRYAGRIRYAGLPANDDGVVHFVSRRADEVSDYFREFLGCEAVTDSTIQGKHLYSALRSFAEGQQMSAEERQTMMQRTYSYWSECKKTGRPMAMTALSNLLRPEDPTIVLQHLTHESTGLAGEFAVPPAKVMRQFVKFAFNHAGLKIEFDRNDWLDKITVRNESVTIRRAPPELIQQINAEKNGDA